MKTKKSIFPREIWMIDFKENSSFLTAGKHPAIILNSYKHISKNKYFIHVSPLTSQDLDKLLRSHVIVEGYGLDRKSKIQLEQIMTVSENDLLWRIGIIDDINKNKEIDETLNKILLTESEGQIELDNVIDIFSRNVESIKQKEELNRLTDLVRQKYYKENDNIATEELANKLFEDTKIAKLSIETKNSFYWCAKYTLATLAYDRKDIQESIRHIEESLKYVNKDEKHYALSLWNLGTCLDELGEHEKAIKIFNYLSKFYKINNMPKERTMMVFNLAVCRRNFKAMKTIREYVSSNKDNVWYQEIEKQIIINSIDREIERLRTKFDII